MVGLHSPTTVATTHTAAVTGGHRSLTSPKKAASDPILREVSPRHARQSLALASGRNINMKNLSLNLVGAAGRSPGMSLPPQPSLLLLLPPLPLPPAGAPTSLPPPTASCRLVPPPGGDSSVAFQPPPLLLRRNTLTLTIPKQPDRLHDRPMLTPGVTKTPLIPPLLSEGRFESQNGGEDYRIDSPIIAPSHSLPLLPPPAPPPPPLRATPPNLQSPFAMPSSVMPNEPSEVNTKLEGLTLCDTVQLDGPITTTTTTTHLTPKFSLRVPEELQELSQLEAYPLGPANVLNGSLFLFSDPDPMLLVGPPPTAIDINDYDLVINVARECLDLSPQYDDRDGTREYVHVTWSHTSSILRLLPILVKKIAKYDDSDLRGAPKRRVLVHCQCGVSRSACVVVGYYMYKFGVGVNEAYELLKSGTQHPTEPFNGEIKRRGYEIEACDRICPNMSLIFELMEFGDSLKTGM